MLLYTQQQESDMLFLFGIPAVFALVALFFGLRMSKPAFAVTLLLWWGALFGLVAYMEYEPLPVLLCTFLGLLGVIAAMCAGYACGTYVTPSPAEVVAEAACEAAKSGHDAYVQLDPVQKEQLHRGAKLVAKLGLRYASAKLMQHGKQPEASLLRNSAKLL